MIDLDDMRQELIRDEGRVLHAYPDSESYLTLGVGRCIDVRVGGGISLEESEILLNNDILGVIESLTERLPWFENLDQVRQRVLINMAFNLGVSRLMKFSDTLDAIKRGKYELAAIHMLDSRWAHQVGTRAKRLSNMMKLGHTNGA